MPTHHDIEEGACDSIILLILPRELEIFCVHAVHSTASWTRSEGIWKGPDFPFSDGC